MIILPQDDMGSRIGRSLGTGLEEALSNWSQAKLNKLMQNQNQLRYAKAFEGLGIPAQKAAGLALFPEGAQKELIKAIKEHIPLNELFSQLGFQDQGFSPLQELQSHAIEPENPGNMETMEALRNILSPTTINPMDNLVRAHLNNRAPAFQNKFNQQTQPINAESKPLMGKAQHEYKPRTIAEAKQYAEQQKIAKLEQHALDKEYQPVMKELRDKYKGALEDNRSLDRMEKLIESKNLSRPRFAALVSALKHGIGGYIGLDLSSMLTPESQEFEKLSQGFLKGAKNIFGSRITDNDLNAFMKTIPNLSQSREGKRRIIYNMRLFNDASIAKKKAADEIIQENNGHIPRNLEGLIEERAKRQLDDIAEKFNIGYQKPHKEYHASGKYMLGTKIPHPVKEIGDLIFGKG